ncbi:hypothetical protein O7626_19465 [Micromonospora sp. WMMD1102]|uniref:hypothetical protein n=1 Tax=Micromonospora sp. WMMD1102 TaxID=3016105 RepID=UPI00241524B1|nr:hypothetical protein [Micromonospora sp. WMMD1102]MDG4788093.1 hypothetical protein [Micromonospora sp. WMMD1102]
MTTLEQAVGDRLAAAVEQADQRQADARAAWGTADNGANWRMSFGLGRRTTTTEQGDDQQ